MSPLARPSVYSLPVKPWIWPASLACWIMSIAAWKSASVNFEMSLPCSIITRPTVSRISVSSVTLPLRAGSVSSWVIDSIFLPPVALRL